MERSLAFSPTSMQWTDFKFGMQKYCMPFLSHLMICGTLKSNMHLLADTLKQEVMVPLIAKNPLQPVSYDPRDCFQVKNPKHERSMLLLKLWPIL